MLATGLMTYNIEVTTSNGRSFPVAVTAREVEDFKEEEVNGALCQVCGFPHLRVEAQWRARDRRAAGAAIAQHGTEAGLEQV